MVALLAEKILLQSKQYSAENTKNTIVHKVTWLLGYIQTIFDER